MDVLDFVAVRGCGCVVLHTWCVMHFGTVNQCGGPHASRRELLGVVELVLRVINYANSNQSCVVSRITNNYSNSKSSSGRCAFALP